MPPVSETDPPATVTIQCRTCDFVFDPAAVPGGLCPRCLLLGVHMSPAEEIRSTAETEPIASLADEELSRELPNFDLVQILGRGGMGVVWKATERLLKRHVAIKLLHNVRKDMDFVERFAREARVMAQLNHPNIVTLYSFGRTRSNHCYLVMEMVEGADLGQWLARGPVDLPATLSVMLDLCVALRHAHEAGFMHRDIKPGNVLVDSRGRVKVTDFGLARLTTEPDTNCLTKHGWAVGTPHYIAPEQARGDGLEDHRADIYSVGVMLYQMLTGELPRGVFRLPSTKRKTDKRLDKIVLRALQEDPADRYQSVADLMSDLAQVRRRVDPGSHAGNQDPRHGRRWSQRFELALAVAVSLVLGAVMAIYARGWLWPEAATSESRKLPVLDGGVAVDEGMQSPQPSAIEIARKVRLQPPGLSNGSYFGRSLASDGKWLAVGAPDDESRDAGNPGNVYLYQRDTTRAWVLRQIVSNPRRGGRARFGYDVALDGARLLVGSPRRVGSANGNGGVDLYELSPSGFWRQAPRQVFPSWETEAAGLEVQLAGDRMMVLETPGAIHDESKGRSATVFRQLPEQQRWSRVEMKDAAPFSCCVVTPFDWFVVGCADAAGPNRTPLLAANWSQQDPLSKARAISPDMLPPQASAGFISLAASAGQVLAGNPHWRDSSGIAWMLRRHDDGKFVYEGNLLPPAEAGACEFGKSVALIANWAAIGAERGGTGDPRRGAVHLYRRESGGSWQPAQIIEPDAGAGAMAFGHGVILAPDFVAIGAPTSGRPGAVGDEAGYGAVFIREFASPLR